METEGSDLSIYVKPHHLFRYPSEWDPRQPGKTKGGYLEGRIQLPRNHPGDLRVVLSTYPDHSIYKEFSEELVARVPDVTEVHPTMLHVVRKGKGNRRFSEKEPVPSIQHWRQEFLVVGSSVRIRNKTSIDDEPRYSEIARIPAEEEMFQINNDRVLRVGKEAGELNLILLIPKTEKRSLYSDVSMNKVLASRVEDKEAIQSLISAYTGKNVHNLKKMRLRVDVFSLQTGDLLGTKISGSISDTASKAHGAMDLYDVTPLRSCSCGGRKVVMIAEFGLAKDVEPRFQLFDSQGNRLSDLEGTKLNQPAPDLTMKMRECIIFITPSQPLAETILQRGWEVKLVAQRSSDGLVSRKKFVFDFVPHDYYHPCVFCAIRPDLQPGETKATIVPQKELPRPGLRKRIMDEEQDVKEITMNTDSSSKKSKLDGNMEELPPPSISPPHLLSESQPNISLQSSQLLQCIKKPLPELKRIPPTCASVERTQLSASRKTVLSLIPSHMGDMLQDKLIFHPPSVPAQQPIAAEVQHSTPSRLSLLLKHPPRRAETENPEPSFVTKDSIKTESEEIFEPENDSSCNIESNIHFPPGKSAAVSTSSSVPFHDLAKAKVVTNLPGNMKQCLTSSKTLMFPNK